MRFGDAPDRAEALDVDLDEPVIPAHALREPAREDAGTLGADDQAAVVVDPLAAVEQDHRVLEVLRVYRQRVLPQGARQGIAAVERDAGGDAEVGQALPSDAECQRVLERLEARQKAVGLDHHARAGRGGARLLKLADELLEIDLAAGSGLENADVRIDHQHGLDVLRQRLEQAPQCGGLAAVDAVIEAAPAGLAQPQQRCGRWSRR